MSSRVDADASLLPEEDLISRSFLSTVLALSLAWVCTFLLGGMSGWLPVEPLHLLNSLGFALVTVALLVTLRRQWMPHRKVAIVYFVVLYLYIASAQFLMPSDQLRILLFYPALGAVLFVLGYRAAFLALLVSYAVFGAAVLSGAMTVSPVAATSFLVTLGLTGLFFRIFHRQAMQALHLVAEKNALLAAAAHRDPLTGLLNLRAFHDLMVAEMSEPNAQRPVAVLFLDVDHFKPVNDQFGHAGGDAVLKALAAVLKDAVRQEDYVARIGGEEFAIFLPGAGQEIAARVAERVRASVEKMRVDMGRHPISITLSVGVAVSDPPHPSPDALVRAADLAMYEAKMLGRNRVVDAAPP
ncbi:diguanylate cyclase [Aquabacter sp. L1I39]|uniref:GGDEF domain-containing protein n=1 Tax=Aquabacter sp. L1I39 TaxID=2820278 RepID=UPI001ADBCB81|nr:GGDEF domain-containing protein [Aquabacter sp. L1I39]QTL05082.1 diguanylate cyclase [Aquabacter sp. L1I39]